MGQESIDWTSFLEDLDGVQRELLDRVRDHGDVTDLHHPHHLPHNRHLHAYTLLKY